MPKYFAFTAEFSGITDRIITKGSVFTVDPVTNIESPKKDINALWDTGATRSVIDKSLAQSLALVPKGSLTMLTAGGPIPSRTYCIWFQLPNGVKIRDVIVSEADFGSSNFDVLLGMDVICCGDFAISNKDGKTKMSYCAPSYFDVDFLKDLKNLAPKIGRNDPCPCGKKKPNGQPEKFKFCCGNV